MPAVTLLAMFLTAGPGPAVSPVDAAASSVLTYWLSFGAIAVIAFFLFFLYVWPGKITQKARDEARADLLEEIKNLRDQRAAEIKALTDRAERAEEQRDEALKITQDKVIPLLVSFTATTTGLIPLLQDLLRSREREAQARGQSG